MGVARVHVRSWQVAYKGLLPAPYLDALRPEDRASRYTFGRSDPTAPATVVAILDGVIQGFATTAPAGDEDLPGYGELYALYIDPDCWGRGIGAALMREARARLKSAGFQNAMLWMLAGNVRAQQFYEKDGWRFDGKERTAPLWGIMTHDMRLRASLAPKAD